MPLILPPVDDTRLARSPLAVVVCQVRYEQSLAASDGGVALAISRAFGARKGPYPRLEQQQLFAAQVDLNGLTGATVGNAIPSRGWKMSSPKGDWTVTIMPDHASLETNAYTTWSDDFLPRIKQVMEVVRKHVAPEIEERLGLRYVNRIPQSDDRLDWKGIIEEDLLGAASSEFWTAGLDNMQQQLKLDLGDELQCIMRHGMVPDFAGQPDGYLLDYDIFRQSPQEFDADSMVAALNDMNRAALSLFQISLTKEYLDSIRESG